MAPTIARTETLLSIEDVCLSFDEKEVLSHVNATVENLHRDGDGGLTGQVVAFLGPSGCGKTSLLRILAGLQAPTSGQVYLGARREKAHAGIVGMVSQNAILFRKNTVIGNLIIAAKQAGLSWNDARHRAIDLLTQFDLLDKADLYPIQLSGGQRQRVAVAQQLLCSEHFLLFDEPTAGLDPLSKRKVCELIAKVANQDDLNTIVFCSHDIRTSIQIADTLWLMGRRRDEAGKIIGGSYIVKQYDLIEEGLCWQPDVIKHPHFQEVERQVLSDFDRL